MKFRKKTPFSVYHCRKKTPTAGAKSGQTFSAAAASPPGLEGIAYALTRSFKCDILDKDFMDSLSIYQEQTGIQQGICFDFEELRAFSHGFFPLREAKTP